MDCGCSTMPNYLWPLGWATTGPARLENSRAGDIFLLSNHALSSQKSMLCLPVQILKETAMSEFQLEEKFTAKRVMRHLTTGKENKWRSQRRRRWVQLGCSGWPSWSNCQWSPFQPVPQGSWTYCLGHILCRELACICYFNITLTICL